jgi:hypothetical protein
MQSVFLKSTIGIYTVRLYMILSGLRGRGPQEEQGASGQGRRTVRWRILDKRCSQQISSCRRGIYVLESGRKPQEKSGFREPLADMPGRYWKYGTYRLAVMGLEEDPLN